MSYTPNNPPIYLAAFAGAIAGLGACTQPITAVSNAASLADAYAQAIDQAWGAGTYTSLDLNEIREASEAVWENRSRIKSPDGNSRLAYVGLAGEIVALVRAGTAQVVAEGVDPNATGGGGTSNPSWLVPQWYIDGQNTSGNASDNNAGTSAAAPLRTWQQGLLGKWGTDSPKLPQDTTITYLSSQQTGDYIQFRRPILATSKLIVTRDFNALAPGGPTAIGAVTAKDHTAALPGGLLTVTYNNPVARSMLIQNTTRGSRAFVQGTTLGNVGRMLQPITITAPVELPVPAMDNGWTAGDQIKALADVHVTIACIGASGGFQDMFPNPSKGTVWFIGLHVDDPSGTPGTSDVAGDYPEGTVVFSDCWLDSYLSLALDGTQIGIQTFLNGGGEYGTATLIGGGAGDFVFIPNAQCFIDGDHIFEGNVNVFATPDAGGVGIFPGKQITVYPGASWYMVNGLAGAPALFGGGVFECLSNTALLLTGANTFAATVHVTLGAGGSSGGSKFNPATGVWSSPAAAFTPANIDAAGAFVGLQDPNLGIRFVNSA